MFGLVFLGLVPGMQRELRIHRLPAAGLLGAPVLGAVFALSWVPCVGPTLGAVSAWPPAAGRPIGPWCWPWRTASGSGCRSCSSGCAFRRLLGVFRVVRRNSRWVTRIGGALLIADGPGPDHRRLERLPIWLLTTFDLDVDPGTLL